MGKSSGYVGGSSAQLGFTLKDVAELANETQVDKLFCAKALKACYGDKEQAKQWLELNGHMMKRSFT